MFREGGFNTPTRCRAENPEGIGIKDLAVVTGSALDKVVKSLGRGPVNHDPGASFGGAMDRLS